MTNETTTAARAPEALESEPCTRCGGTGSYSYCQRYGTRCFRCAGRKITYTKRGAVAARHLSDLRSKPAAEVKPGDVIRVERWHMGDSITTSWETVERVADHLAEYPAHPHLVAIYSRNAKGETFGNIGLEPTKLVRIRQTPEQVAATLALALAFQATLTKTGTPRKRKGGAA